MSLVYYDKHINYSEGMAEDQKDRYNQYLAEENQDLKLTEKAMQFVLEDFMVRQKELEERMSAFMFEQASIEELLEERKMCKSAERKAKTLEEQLDYANQERFGDRCQKVREKPFMGESKKPKPDRENEEDGFDETEDTLQIRLGSDVGAEMAATYHSVIGTVKLHGSSFWEFIGAFFKNVFNGCRDYVNMTPDKITLVTSRC